MHNVLKIASVVHREALTVTLSVEGYNNLENTVHFYSYTRDKVPHTGRRQTPDELQMTG